MIFVHGWPGSFLEARKKIQPLNSPPSENDQAFRLVVLSLPGYGSGPPPTNPTFGPATTARAFKTLMVDTLGLWTIRSPRRDWGGFFTRSMTMQYSQHVHTCHHNFFPCGLPPFYKAPLTIGRLVLNS